MEKMIKEIMAKVKSGKWGEAARMCRENGICGFTDEEGTTYEVLNRYYRVIGDIERFANWLAGLGLAWLDKTAIGAFVDEVKIYNGNLDYEAQLDFKINDIRSLLRKEGIEIPSGTIQTAVKPYIIRVAA